MIGGSLPPCEPPSQSGNPEDLKDGKPALTCRFPEGPTTQDRYLVRTPLKTVPRQQDVKSCRTH
jgi:hypothetical protein